MKKIPDFVVLTIITLVAAALLAATNQLTSGYIAQASLVTANASRFAALPSAEDFTDLEAPEGIDALCKGTVGGETVGYVVTATSQGYAGPIEIIIGMDLNGTVTGITVGGSNFAETAGLGSKVKESAFADQFIGKAGAVILGDDIDAVTSATISSRAVVVAVNKALESMQSIQ